MKHRRHALLWVRTGSAHVHLDETSTIQLSAGEGVWLPPADGWSHHGITTEPGTVAFPLWLHADVGVGALSEPTRFEVPDGWQDWLIQNYNLLVTPLTGRGYSQGGLFDLLVRPNGRSPADVRDQPGCPVAPDPPALPRARGARAVAEELLSDPALSLTVEEWAARVHSSARTLRRDFLADTALTFEQWRLRCRLSAAVEFLIAGFSVDQVAARVGFASRSGFGRAFRQQFGSTPHEFSRMLSAHQIVGDLSQRVTAARQADHLVTMVRAGAVAPDAPELLPATRTTPHANDSHVLCWAYRGSGYLDVGGHRYEWGRGGAIWIPAGVEHVTGLRQDSISLPIGDAGAGELRLAEPLQAQFPPAWDDYLMFCSVSARSVLRPEGYDPAHVVDLFREQIAAQRALSVPMPTDARAHAAATSFLRTMAASNRAAGWDLPGDVHRAFLDETGMTFARWRYAARMRVARDLLAAGAKPVSVAHRVGYAHLSNFSAAFTRFHGLPPRDYQERL